MQLGHIHNQTVLVKVNYDLPNLKSYWRILDSFQTINQLLQNGNKIVLLSHWGRPDGQNRPELSLKLILPVLKKCLKESEYKLLNQAKLEFIDQFTLKATTEEKIGQSKANLILLENTRFEPREQSKDTYVRQDLAEIYSHFAKSAVNEAFALSHRQEATNTELMKLLPSCLGKAFESEILHLDRIRLHQDHPLALVLGGAKLETKLALLQKLLPLADVVLLGGAVCFTFLRAKGELEDNQELLRTIQDAPTELDFLDTAKELYQMYSTKLVLPIDFVLGKKVPMDIGKQTVELFAGHLQGVRSLFWNGPMGKYEDKKFQSGTLKLAKIIAKLPNCYKVLGGGDTNSALPRDILNEFDYVSMGGGATLDYLGK
jgi:phosphoglycerate kinase